jgi:hypothetical protein
VYLIIANMLTMISLGVIESGLLFGRTWNGIRVNLFAFQVFVTSVLMVNGMTTQHNE